MSAKLPLISLLVAAACARKFAALKEMGAPPRYEANTCCERASSYAQRRVA
jgi:hypothetical protein